MNQRKVFSKKKRENLWRYPLFSAFEYRDNFVRVSYFHKYNCHLFFSHLVFAHFHSGKIIREFFDALRGNKYSLL